MTTQNANQKSNISLYLNGKDKIIPALSHNKTIKGTIKKTVFYCRKSQESEERQALSIPSQIDECWNIAGKYNIPTENLEIIEESKTAKQPGRPKFTRLIEDMIRGNVDYIVCWKLDRLSRNAVDGLNIIHLLEQKAIQKIVTIQQEYLPEANHIMMYLEFGMAAQYSRDLSENVKRGNKKKLESGWYTGAPPLGYLNNPDKHGTPIINDPERYHLVKKMWNLMLTSQYTVPQVLDIANTELSLTSPKKQRLGGRPIAQSGLYLVFKNPFYYGLMKRGDVEAWGKHEPMITEAEFNRVQEIIGMRSSPRPKNKEFAFRGTIRCGECGCMVTAEYTTNRYGTRYTYYHCTKKRNTKEFKCGQKTIRLEKLEEQITEALKQIEIPESFKNWAIEHLNELSKEEAKEVTKRHRAEEQNSKRIQDKLDKLMQMRLEDLIDNEEFLNEKSKLLKEKRRIEEILNGVKYRAESWYDLSVKTFEFANGAKEWFKTATKSEKTGILLTMGTDFKLMDRELEITWQKPLELIKNGKERIRLEPLKIEAKLTGNGLNVEFRQKGGLELEKSIVTKGKNESQKEQILLWCARTESNCQPPDP